MELLKAAGYDDKTLYTHTAKSLSVLEKTIGVKKFQEILGKQIVKPVGAPTLVVASDKREPYNSAKADFAEVVS